MIDCRTAQKLSNVILLSFKVDWFLFDELL